MFNFTVKEFILGNGTGTPTLQFYRRGFTLNGGNDPSWQDIVLSGVGALTLTNAKADGLNYVKLFGACEQTNLPKEYTQLEYIQANGTQYIDSGIIPISFDYEIETVFAFDEVNTGSVPLCAWGYMGLSSSLPRWLLASYQSKYLLNVNTTSAIGSQDTNKHTFKTTVYLEDTTPRWSSYIDGAVYNDNQAVVSDTFFTNNTLSIYLFARHNSDGVGNNVSGKMYHHTVKKAGVKIQELIPAKRNSDNVVGLYDTVTGTFFTNDGTGSFTAGSNATPSPDCPINIVCNNGTIKAKHESGLPLNYTKVNDVTNTTINDITGYIDTGIKADVDDIEFDVVATINTPTTASWYILQSRGGTSAPIYGISGSNTGNTFLASFSGTNLSIPNTIVRQYGHTYHVNLTAKNGNVTFTVKDLTNNVSETTSGTYTFTQAPTNIGLFGNMALSNNNSPQTLTAGNTSVLSAYVKKNGIKVMDYIPCTYNDVAGFYDTVSQSFKGATEGGFTAGSASTDNVITYADGTAETVEVHGKNLLNPLAITEDKYITSTGTINSDSSFAISDYIKVAGSSRITISTTDTGAYPLGGAASNAFYDANKNFISGSGAQNSSITSTNPMTRNIPANAVYFRTSVKKTGASKCQVELNGSATTFEAYYNGGSATAQNLLAVGNYKDVQEVLTGAVTRNVGVLVLDGTENWGWIDGEGHAWRGTAYLINPTQVNSASPISTHFRLLKMLLTSGNLYIRYLNDDGITTKNEWLQWLQAQYNSGNPVIVVYPLATATTESVTAQTLTTQSGTNIVEITQASINNLPLEVSYKGTV